MDSSSFYFKYRAPPPPSSLLSGSPSPPHSPPPPASPFLLPSLCAQVDEMKAKGVPYAYRFRVPLGGRIDIVDLIRGHVGWDTEARATEERETREPLVTPRRPHWGKKGAKMGGRGVSPRVPAQPAALSSGFAHSPLISLSLLLPPLPPTPPPPLFLLPLSRSGRRRLCHPPLQRHARVQLLRGC